MRRVYLPGLIALMLISPEVKAQTPLPAVNTPLTGCVEGRALRIVNGAPSCAASGTPTLSSCGTTPSLSSNATDFAGQITIGTGIVTTCVLTMTKLYTSPGLGCVAQTNSTTSIASTPVVGSNGSQSTMTITVSLSLPGGKVTYACFPV